MGGASKSNIKRKVKVRPGPPARRPRQTRRVPEFYRAMVSVADNGSLVCSVDNPAPSSRRPRICSNEELARIIAIFAQLQPAPAKIPEGVAEYARPACFAHFELQDGTEVGARGVRQVLWLRHEQLLFTLVHQASRFQARMALLHMKSVFLSVQAEEDVSRFIEEDFKFQEQEIHNSSGLSLN